jgi:glutathione S-transferase
MVHASTALEPSVEDIHLKRESTSSMVGWSPVGDEFAFVEMHLGAGPYLFRERFTAADVMIGGVLIWTKLSGVALPTKLDAYVGRLMSRPVLAKLFKESQASA